MRRAVALLATLWAGAALASPVPQPPPKILVRFVVEASQFVKDLGDQKPECEKSVSAAAAEQLSASFPFLTWVTDGPADHQLTLALTERPGLGDLDTYVEYRSSDVRGSSPAHLLYSWADPRERDDPEPLISEVREKVRSDLQMSTAAMNDYFASQVPIAEKVAIDSRRVIVPLTGVPLDSSSVLNVKFTALNQPGEMRLTDTMEDRNGGIFCDVVFFSHHGVVVDRWAPLIGPLMMNEARDVQVLMLKYNASPPNARDGTVTTFR